MACLHMNFYAKIKNELKANAMSVPCDLGGEAHGHLRSVLVAVEYVKITPIAYAHPVHPVQQLIRYWCNQVVIN